MRMVAAADLEVEVGLVTVKVGEVSVPVAASPPVKLSTKPVPTTPSTADWPGSGAVAGAAPNAVPVVGPRRRRCRRRSQRRMVPAGGV